MSEPFIGEVRAFGFNYVPSGWAHCNGDLLDIAGNQALFALLGTTYGGDGESTFALPNIPGLATSESGVALSYCIAVQGLFPPRD